MDTSALCYQNPGGYSAAWASGGSSVDSFEDAGDQAATSSSLTLADGSPTHDKTGAIATRAFVEPLLREPVTAEDMLGGPCASRPDVTAYIRQQQRDTWFDTEIDVSGDDLNDLTPGEQTVVKHVLAFFATADGIIMENLASNFINEIQMTDVNMAHQLQGAMEAVHASVYAALLRHIVPDPIERHAIVCSTGTVFTAAQAKADWARQWMSRDRDFGERLVAFTCVEGLLFSSSFALLFAIQQKYQGKKLVMPGLMKSNEFIQRDENMHAVFHGRVLYAKLLQRKVPTARVHDILMSAVAAEEAFLDGAFAGVAIGEANRDTMMTYIRHQANTIAQWLGVPEPFVGRSATNPFPWMARMALTRQPNFFEQNPGGYSTMRSTTDAAKHHELACGDDF